MGGYVEDRARTRLSYEVRVWRETVLTQAGFEPALARRLAAQADYDLHELLNLVDRGCRPDLAARILAPV